MVQEEEGGAGGVAGGGARTSACTSCLGVRRLDSCAAARSGCPRNTSQRGDSGSSGRAQQRKAAAGSSGAASEATQPYSVRTVT